MIIELIVNLLTGALEAILFLLPDLPALPQSILTSIDNVTSTIFANVNLLGLFVRIDTIKTLVPLLIVVLNFEHIYHFSMWIVRKLPLSTN